MGVGVETLGSWVGGGGGGGPNGAKKIAKTYWVKLTVAGSLALEKLKLSTTELMVGVSFTLPHSTTFF